MRGVILKGEEIEGSHFRLVRRLMGSFWASEEIEGFQEFNQLDINQLEEKFGKSLNNTVLTWKSTNFFWKN